MEGDLFVIPWMTFSKRAQSKMKIKYSTKFKKDLGKIGDLEKKGDSIREELKLVLNILL